jgi:hypothetical protein
VPSQQLCTAQAWLLPQLPMGSDSDTFNARIPSSCTERYLMCALSRGTVPQVLSVDDDPVNQMVVQNTLTKAGLAVLKAADGQKALDMLQVCVHVWVGLENRLWRQLAARWCVCVCVCLGT